MCPIELVARPECRLAVLQRAKQSIAVVLDLVDPLAAAGNFSRQPRELRLERFEFLARRLSLLRGLLSLRTRSWLRCNNGLLGGAFRFLLWRTVRNLFDGAAADDTLGPRINQLFATR